MASQQNAETENFVSCLNCGQVLFSCFLEGWLKIKCSKCQTWQRAYFNEKGVLTMAREPPNNGK